MSCKAWPKGNKTVMFTDLVAPCRSAIEFAFDLKRKNRNRSIPWGGYDIGSDTKVTTFAPDEALRLRNLRYNEQDQGRDALDVILGIAIQLGIEQGRRVAYERLETTVDLLIMQVRGVYPSVKNLRRIIECKGAGDE